MYAFLIPIHSKSKSSVFFVMLILFLYRMDFVKYVKDALSNKIVQAFLFFYLVWLFGFIYTENFAYGQDSIHKAKYLLFPLFFLSFLDKRFSFRIISAFILGMLLSELVSYCIRFGLLPHELFIYSYEIYKSFAYNNPAPFFTHSDHNIGLSIVVSFLLYQLLNKDNSKIIKIVSVLFIITASINITFIGSRTGYVLYLFLIALVLIISCKKNIKKAILVALLITIPISFLAYNYSSMIHKRVDLTLESFNNILNNDNYNSSIGLRLGFAKYSLDVIKQNPIIGVGTGDYMDAVHSVIPAKHRYIANTNLISQPHNVYLKTLLQFGVVGLIFLLFIFYRLFSYKDIDSYNKGLIVILSSAILIAMLPGKFYGYFVLPMFVTLISALVVKKSRDIAFKEVDFKMILIYSILTLSFLIIGITK